MEYLTTRKAAKAKGDKYYFTGKPCIRGHVAPRETKGNCVECRKEDAAIAVASGERIEYLRNWNRSDAGQASKKAYYEKNRDKVIERAKAQDPELRKQYKRKWKQENPEQRQIDNNTRRRRLRDATPKWLTAAQKIEIKLIYAEAMKKTKETGVKYTVDHYYPINGDLVCGLHVPSNLVLMPHRENAKKGNRMPD